MKSVEGKLRRKIKDSIQMRYSGSVVYHVHGEGHQEAGIPDLICCIEGRFLGLEVKDDEEEEATPIQKYQMNRINNAGGFSKTVHSIKEAVDFIDWAVYRRGE